MRDLVAARVAGVSSMVHRGQGCPAASALMIAPQYGQQTLRLEPVAGGATVAGAESLGGKSVARLISSSPPSISASDIPDSTFRRSLQRRLQAERTANPALRAICRLKSTSRRSAIQNNGASTKPRRAIPARFFAAVHLSSAF